MNNLKSKSQENSTLSTQGPLSEKGRIIKVRLDEKVELRKIAASATLSSRPSRSVFKARSLTKPIVGRKPNAK